jgi:ABC-type uncharacterized transport system involved in gliding motility auxiliary subunit
MFRLRNYIALFLEIATALALIAAAETVLTALGLTFDLTPEKTYSLSLKAKEALRAVKEDLKITVFVKREGEQGKIRSLLELYARENRHVRYDLVNLDRNPGQAKKYDVHSYYTTVLEYKGRVVKTGYPWETNISPALSRLLDKWETVLHFSSGSEENDFFAEGAGEHGFDFARLRLEREGYGLKPFSLKESVSIPDDLRVLVISGPRKDLPENALTILRRLIDSGRNLIFLLDPVPLPNLEKFLEGYGITLPRRVIADSQGHAQGWDEWTVIVPFINKNHPMASGLTQPAVFPLCRPVNLTVPEDGRTTPLLGTSDTSWAVTEDTIKPGDKPFSFDSGGESSDMKGPITVGVAREIVSPQNKISKIAVLGNSKFVDNTYIKLLGNGELFLNAIQWAVDESTISLREKGLYGGAFNLSAGQFRNLQLLCLALPAVTLLIGCLVALLKRYRR